MGSPMTPLTVRRYSFLQQEAIELLLGDVLGDCLQWQLRVDGDQLIVDIVPSEQDEPRKKRSRPSTDPERKGGPLARRAAFLCANAAFRKFLTEKHGATVANADAAKAWMLQHFGIASRAEIDHYPLVAARFQEVEDAYKLWMEGYD